MDKSPRRYFYQPVLHPFCCTVLGFTLMVGDSLCELSIRERGMEFKAVLAYESKK